MDKDQSFPLKTTNPVIFQDHHSASEVTTTVSGTDKEDIGNLLLQSCIYDLCRKISVVSPNDANQEVQEDLFTTEVTIAYELLATDITLCFIGHHS